MSDQQAGTCATCRWWEPDEDETGTCAMTIYDGEDEAATHPETLAVALTYEDTVDVWLMTNASFGCNQWQPRANG